MHLAGRFLTINGRFRLDVECGQGGENLLPTIMVRRRLASGFGIAAPEQRKLANGIHAHGTTPKANCNTTPAMEQASSV